MLVVLIFDAVSAGIAHYIETEASYDTEILILINDPLELEVPMFFDKF